MSTDRRDILDDAELDRLLETAAREPVEPPSEDLMRRVLADAAEHRPTVGAAAHRQGVLGRLLAQIGGLTGAAGLVAAGLAGLMIGYADTGLVSDGGAAIGLEMSDYDIGDFYAGYAAIDGDG